VLPGAVFQRYGWRMFLMQLMLMLVLALVFTRLLKKVTYG
jgi:hypothetical protein